MNVLHLKIKKYHTSQSEIIFLEIFTVIEQLTCQSMISIFSMTSKLQYYAIHSYDNDKLTVTYQCLNVSCVYLKAVEILQLCALTLIIENKCEILRNYITERNVYCNYNNNRS